MKITLHYLGPLRYAAGMDAETWQGGENALLTQALNEAASRHPEQFATILFDARGELRPSLLVLVNEVPVDRNPLPRLHDGDEVTLLPAIAGG